MQTDSRQDFWEFIDQLVIVSSLVIDRPAGSTHPRYPDLIYPLDYGNLEGTTAGDGGGIDVWLGASGSLRPVGLVLTVDLLKKDAEIKILLGCSPAEMLTILDFTNGQSMRAVLVRRDTDGLELLNTRRSVRRFLPQPVPEQAIRRLLAAAVQAPSAHNRQPWRFAVLAAPEIRRSLAESMGADFRRDLLADGLPPEEVELQIVRSFHRISDAPLAILLSLDASEMDLYPDPFRQQAEQWMAVQSVAMAGQNLLLAAQAEGLGGVWMCAPLFAPQAVRRALDLPETWEPQGLLLVGYPAKIPEPKPRRLIEDVTRFYV
jgi:F420 biosynthesis protein FbiB-like protein